MSIDLLRPSPYFQMVDELPSELSPPVPYDTIPYWFYGVQGCNCDYCQTARLRRGESPLVPAWYTRTDPKKHKDCTYTRMMDIPNAAIRTQKARGIKSLNQYPILSGVRGGAPGNSFLIPHQMQHVKDAIVDADGMFPTPMFARPCPVRPRHGFVESRIVQSWNEAMIVLGEAREEDADAELILMPLLTGRLSAVATNRSVAWGQGHDAVTGGGNAITVPTVGSVKRWNNWWDHQLTPNRPTRDIRNTAYAELVEGENQMYAVQLRDGPEQPGAANYIPRKIKVTEVFYQSGSDNLIAWEKKLKKRVKAGDTEGLVVNMPGSSLSSHWAVHALQFGIPVVTTHSVFVGCVLEPEGTKLPKLLARDLKKLKTMLSKLEKVDYLVEDEVKLTVGSCTIPQAVTTAFASVHSMPYWDNSPHLMRLRAYALTTLPRVIFAACAGELRHWSRGRAAEPMKTSLPIIDAFLEQMADFSSDERSEVSIDRADVYVDTIRPIPLRTISEHLCTMADDFSEKNWGTGASFGGTNWQNVAIAGHKLCQTLIRFKKRPDAVRWNEVVLAANVAIHQVHNGGRVLNKWISDDVMSAIGFAPSIGFMNIFAGSIALDLPFDCKRPENSNHE